MKRLLGVVLVAAMLGTPLLVSAPASAQVSVGISVRIGPPPLPVYPQPFAPGPGYIWTPGYWAWAPDGYYWVPGTWVMAPAVGLLWTPGYWGWRDGMYWWRAGYWGPTVGYYGGINYGYGYVGVGYAGGYWRSGTFYYNRAVSNVNVTYIHNTYNEAVVHNDVTVNRVSYNGGSGGTRLQPTAEQEAYAQERHTEATEAQVRQQRVAMSNPQQRFTANQGRPQVAATARAGIFSGPGAVRRGAQGAYAYRPAARDRTAYQNERSSGRPEMNSAPGQYRQPETRAERPTERQPAKAHEKRRCRPNDPHCR